MDQPSLEQKRQQFHSFFTIEHNLNINMRVMPEGFEPPEPEQLVEHMPYEFRIACDVANIEANALRPLRNLGDKVNELVDFLKYQSRKIDLIMSIVLHQQDDPDNRYQTVAFGGGGVIVDSAVAYPLGAIMELKLFLSEEASAVFCYGEVIACEDRSGRYHISLIFTCIREEDQEQLVRASLHLQTQQLKKRRKN